MTLRTFSLSLMCKILLDANQFNASSFSHLSLTHKTSHRYMKKHFWTKNTISCYFFCLSFLPLLLISLLKHTHTIKHQPRPSLFKQAEILNIKKLSLFNVFLVCHTHKENRWQHFDSFFNEQILSTHIQKWSKDNTTRIYGVSETKKATKGKDVYDYNCLFWLIHWDKSHAKGGEMRRKTEKWHKFSVK